jgi:hypothetical protein
MIAIGRFPNSNGLQFYNPANGTFVSSIDCKFQLHTTSGAHFGYKYQPGAFIYRLDEFTSIFALKFALDLYANATHIHLHVFQRLLVYLCMIIPIYARLPSRMAQLQNTQTIF